MQHMMALYNRFTIHSFLSVDSLHVLKHDFFSVKNITEL